MHDCENIEVFVIIKQPDFGLQFRKPGIQRPFVDELIGEARFCPAALLIHPVNRYQFICLCDLQDFGCFLLCPAHER